MEKCHHLKLNFTFHLLAFIYSSRASRPKGRFGYNMKQHEIIVDLEIPQDFPITSSHEILSDSAAGKWRAQIWWVNTNDPYRNSFQWRLPRYWHMWSTFSAKRRWCFLVMKVESDGKFAVGNCWVTLFPFFWHELPDIQTDLSTRTILSWKVEVLHRALHLYIILDICTCPHIIYIHIYIYMNYIYAVYPLWLVNSVILRCSWTVLHMLVGGWRCSLFDSMHRILC